MSLRFLFPSRLNTLAILIAGSGFGLASGCSGGSGEITFDDEAYAEALEFVDINTGEACEPDMESYIPGNGDQGGDTAMGVPTTSPDEDRRGGDDNRYNNGSSDDGSDDASKAGSEAGDGTCDGTGSGGSSGMQSGSGSQGGEQSGSGSESGQQTGSGGESGQQYGSGGEGGQQYGSGSGSASGQQSGGGSANGDVTDAKAADDTLDHEYGAGCDADGCCTADGDLTRDRDRIRCRCRLRVRDGDPSELVLPECCELEEEEPPPSGYPSADG